MASILKEHLLRKWLSLNMNR